MRTIFILILTVLTITSCLREKEQVKPSNPLRPRQSKVTTPERKVQENVKTQEHKPLNTGGLEWMNMDQLAKIPLSGSKYYLIDIYTEWCGWCKIMDNKTFSDQEVQEYLQENFHLIKFDAERKAPVNFKNKIYNWVEGGKKGHNELALELLEGKMAYPGLVYLDTDLNVIKVSSGYKNPKELLLEMEIVTRS